jgi:hypothetical protein
MPLGGRQGENPRGVRRRRVGAPYPGGMSTLHVPEDSLEAFIGSGDSGDPDWAGRDAHELRAEVRRAASRGGFLNFTNAPGFRS